MLKNLWIKQCIKIDEYYFSKHGDQERKNDNLTIAEIEYALLNGNIIEQYSDTGRGLSCLVAGFSKQGKPIHIVCGEMNDSLVVITVYIPTPPKFKNPWTRSNDE